MCGGSALIIRGLVRAAGKKEKEKKNIEQILQ